MKSKPKKKTSKKSITYTHILLNPVVWVATSTN